MNLNIPPKLSIGKLWDVLELIKILNDTGHHANLKKIQEAFEPRLNAAPLKEVLKICQNCDFLSKQNDFIKLTRSGLELAGINSYNYKTSFKIIISKFIKVFKPSWAYMMQFGKAFMHAEGALPSDTHECFMEAGLFEEDLETIKEWEIISHNLKSEEFSRNDEIGLKGEYLTMLYEHKRTGIEPRWVSRETDTAGFDILSMISDTNDNRLAIEVKASERKLEDACAHITRNEWNISQKSKDYLFYFWLLSKSPRLFSISPVVLKEHVPENQGKGAWESFVVSYNDILVGKQDLFEVVETKISFQGLYLDC